MYKARQGHLQAPVYPKVSLDKYLIHPLYKAVILLLDRYEQVKPGSNGIYDLQKAVDSQSVLIARTGLRS